MPRKPGQKSAEPALPTRQEIIDFVAGAPGKVGKREIARAFKLSGAQRLDLKRLLRDMEGDGLLEGNRKRLHRPGGLPSVTVLLVEGVDEHGDLVAVPLEWDESVGPAPRIPVVRERGRRAPGPAPGIGDRILARLTESADAAGFTARIVKVLAKKPKAQLGVFRVVEGGNRVVPVNRKEPEVTIPAGATEGARDGELVAVEVSGGRHGLPTGRVTERIGDVSSEKAVSLIALEEHGIPHVFPPEAVVEAEGAEPAGMAHREDWRELPLITIDPADARDHDDAVFAEPDPESDGGHIVTVAIADVGWYVRPVSALDREALRRGNSVYFPGRVVPMLPERISNDLGSLREGEDRPALAVRMRFDASGRKTDHSFHRIMMRSAASLSYEEAQAAIDGRVNDRTGPLLGPVLEPLWAAFHALSKGRRARQPLEIDLPERKVILKEDGSVDKVVVPPRLGAHRLIEEFMIQANVAAAETLEGRKAPLVYRIHDEPSLEKMVALRDFLGSLDMSWPKSGTVRPAQFNRVLERFADTPNAILVNEVVLRSQSQAEYSPQNIGHFGLNLRRYAHFTSPIRRYADLLVHRALISALKLGPGGMRREDEAKLEAIAADISLAERRAMLAERDTVDRLIASWLAEQLGARFTGRIRGVTRAGLFIELDHSGADGFVPISTLGSDFYEFDESHHRLVGRSTGETFQLGDAAEVRLVEAQPLAGSLRFEMESEGRQGRPPRGGRGVPRTPRRSPKSTPAGKARRARAAKAR
ncbi:MAG TPA: ribonuclease R [Afifellaceae bacterium]|nr:ribonuclease R [Afifellaceae bacterium]